VVSDEQAHYSGIVVIVRPDRLDSCVSDLDALPGVEVHYRHPESGRIVVVIEGRSTEEHLEMLRRIQALSDVLVAAPVYHYVQTNPEGVKVDADSSAPRREH